MWQSARLSRTNRIWRSYRVARLLFRTLWLMNRERNRVVRARAHGRYDAEPDVKVLRQMLREFRFTAVALGGLLIKLGQFLSARADLLPLEVLSEIAQLQDEVPAECFDDIKAAIEHDLQTPIDEIFSSIDPVPTGSASLGQVHQARLKDGRLVAVKVQRPGIDKIVHTDLSTLRFVLGVIRRLAPSADQMLDLRGLYREFSRVVHEELDYQHEGHNAERFASIFADEEDICAPRVLWEYSTRRVLTLEWMGGIKITNVAGLDAAGIDRPALAHRLAGAYFKQILQLGFFHADPHPGNIFVRPTATGFHLVFVDFGMMGTITQRMHSGLRNCFIGIVSQDPIQLVDGLEMLGFLGEHANREPIEQALGILLAEFSAVPFGRIRDLDMRDMFDEIEELIYDQPLRLPSNFAFLGRAIGMLVGVATLLSPDFNFLEAATPYAKQYMGMGGIAGTLRLLGVDSMDQLGRTLLRESASIARTLSSLPRTMERVLDRAEHGELRLIIDSPTFNPRLRVRMSNRVSTNILNRSVPVWLPLTLATTLTTITLLVRRRGNHR